MDMSRAARPTTSTKEAKRDNAVPTGEATASSELPPAVPIVECPPELGDAARQEWNRLVPHLAKTGVLTEFDLGPLAIYCAAYGQWLEATAAIQQYGTMLKAPSGYPVQSPHVAIANKAADIMLKIAVEYGFTPASRGCRWMLVRDPVSDLLGLRDLSDQNW
jgi:P27 family predicted phage terminase small subunit